MIVVSFIPQYLISTKTPFDIMPRHMISCGINFYHVIILHTDFLRAIRHQHFNSRWKVVAEGCAEGLVVCEGKVVGSRQLEDGSRIRFGRDPSRLSGCSSCYARLSY